MIAIDVVDHGANGAGGAAGHPRREARWTGHLAEGEVGEGVEGGALGGEGEEGEGAGEIVGDPREHEAEGVRVAGGGEGVIAEAIRRGALEGSVGVGEVHQAAVAVDGEELEGADLQGRAEEVELGAAGAGRLELEADGVRGDGGAGGERDAVGEEAERATEREGGARGDGSGAEEREKLGGRGDEELLAVGDAVGVVVVPVGEEDGALACGGGTGGGAQGERGEEGYTASGAAGHGEGGA